MNFLKKLVRHPEPIVVHPPMELMEYPMQEYLDTGEEQFVKVHSRDHYFECPISCGMNLSGPREAVHDSVEETCVGVVLDVGACMGDMSRRLQNAGMQVTAMDISQAAINYMTNIGIRNCFHGDVYSLHNKKFDTILLMGSTLGICGKMENLPSFLAQIRRLLNEGGRIIIEDLNVLEEEGYAEWVCQLQYKHYESTEFDWLNVGRKAVINELFEQGFYSGVIHENTQGNCYVLCAKLPN